MGHIYLDSMQCFAEQLFGYNPISLCPPYPFHSLGLDDIDHSFDFYSFTFKSNSFAVCGFANWLLAIFSLIVIQMFLFLRLLCKDHCE